MTLLSPWWRSNSANLACFQELWWNYVYKVLSQLVSWLGLWIEVLCIPFVPLSLVTYLCIIIHNFVLGGLKLTELATWINFISKAFAFCNLFHGCLTEEESMNLCLLCGFCLRMIYSIFIECFIKDLLK